MRQIRHLTYYDYRKGPYHNHTKNCIGIYDAFERVGVENLFRRSQGLHSDDKSYPPIKIFMSNYFVITICVAHVKDSITSGHVGIKCLHIA